MQKEKKKKSSMFQEDLFTVVVLQRPVASSPFVTLWVQGGRAANLYLRYIELDSLFFFMFLFFWKTIKISFVNVKCLSSLYFITQSVTKTEGNDELKILTRKPQL